ncbi:hypothetical protein BDW22DRAFT_1353239 [Trametopsis cervina]|nr:hypothetical protein BDW22DRAFT_1353239 [Trametopsis cervina]
MTCILFDKHSIKPAVFLFRNYAGSRNASSYWQTGMNLLDAKPHRRPGMLGPECAAGLYTVRRARSQEAYRRGLYPSSPSLWPVHRCWELQVCLHLTVASYNMDKEGSPSEVRASMGALLIGGLVSVFLTGIGLAQAYFYWRVYPKDRWHIKLIVALIWFMDSIHTIFVCVADWSYLVAGFGDRNFDHITWSIGATITLTALVTFLSHCFFTHRIYVVSKGRKVLPIILGLLSCFRLAAALVSTVQMITIASYRGFVIYYSWVFTMGLVAAAGLDVLITVALCYYLRQSKSGFASMNEIIDILIRYTVETGLITCVAAIVSLICWLAMPYNLIFLTMHFTICKFYANCFLATLNSRATLRARSQSTSSTEKDVSIPGIIMSGGSRRPHSAAMVHVNRPPRPSIEFTHPKALHIQVQKSISREVDGEITEVRLNSYSELSPLESASSTRRNSDAEAPVHIENVIEIV